MPPQDDDATVTQSGDSLPLPPTSGTPTVLIPAEAASALPVPPEFHLPRYALGTQFSKGGMGGVWRATEATTGRTVALKKMLRLTDASDFRRFLTEARLTAQLEHPNIVPVHELGLDGEGHVFYSMKLVQGTDLAAVLRKLAEGDSEALARYPLSALLTIFQKVCDAIAFAHSRNVIHRDLKPANIMLGPFGEVLVMDWGLAKVLNRHAEDPDDTGISLPQPSSAREGTHGSETMPGSALGTAYYMAPEQARGEIHAHDARTDIYALGAILYHLLSLRRPVSGSSINTLLARVATGDFDPLNLPPLDSVIDEPTSPALPRPMLRHLPGGTIPASLAAVVHRAMALRSEERYQSVAELQREITAYQGGFATAAERAGLGKQLVLFLLRHRAATSISALALGLLLALATVSYFRIRGERDLAQQQRDRAANLARSEAEQRRLADEQRSTADAQRRLAEEQRSRAEKANLTIKEQLREASRADHAAAETHFRDNRWHEAVAYLGRSLRYDPENQASLNHLWTALLYGQGNREGRMIAAIPFEVDDFESARLPRFFADSGRVFGANFKTHDVQCWDLTGKPVGKRIAWKDRRLHAATLSSDEKTIITLSGSTIDIPDVVQRWDAQTGDAVGQSIELPHPSKWKAGQLSPDGRFVVLEFENKPKTKTVFRNGNFVEEGPPPLPQRVQIYDWEQRKGIIEKTMPPLAYTRVRYLPRGNGVLIQTDFTIDVYELPSGKRIGTVTSQKFPEVIPSPDGFQLFIEQLVPGTIISYDLARWDTKSGKLTGSLSFAETAAGVIRGDNAFLSKDGRWLLSFHRDKGTHAQRAVIHDLNTMKKVAETPPFPIAVQEAGSAFSADGRYFVTCTSVTPTAQGTPKAQAAAQVWETATCKPVGDPMPHPRGVKAATFNGDATLVLTTGFDSTLRVWKVGRTRASARLLVHGPKKVNQKDTYAVHGMWLGGGAKIATIAMGAGELKIWDAATGQATTFANVVGWGSAYVSPSGKWLATLFGEPEVVSLWNGETGQLVGQATAAKSVNSFGDGRETVQFNDSETMLLYSHTGEVRRWSVPDFRPIEPVFNVEEQVRAFSPKGELLLAADTLQRKPATAWNIKTGQQLQTLAAPEGAYWDAVFSADGSRAVTEFSSVRANFAQVWDTATWKTIGPLLRDIRSTPSPVQFAPAGDRLVTQRPVREIGGFGPDSTIQLWNATTMEVVGEPIPAMSFVWSHDGRRIVTATQTGDVSLLRFWDTSNGRPVGDPISILAPFIPVTTFSHDDRWLAANFGQYAQIFDAHTGEPASVRLQQDPALDPKRVLPPSPDVEISFGNIKVQASTPPVTAVQGGSFTEVSFGGISWRPDSRALLGSTDGGASIFETSAPAGRPPDWIQSLIDFVSGQTFNSAGALTPILPSQRVERMRALPAAQSVTPWDRVLELWKE